MNLRSILASLALFLCLSGSVFAQITSNSSGPWNVGSTWVGGVAPTATDNVVITSNHVIDFSATAACNNLTLQNTGVLNFSANSTLTVNGNLSMNGTNTQITGSSNNHIINVTGTYTVPASMLATVGGVRFTINGATNISGYFQFGSSGTGNKTFNGTITVLSGGTWDNLVGEDPFVNCDIVNNGSWPASTGGTGVYQVNKSNVSYNYFGPKMINMSELRLTGGTNVTITNLGILSLTRSTGSANLMDVGAGRSFINGDGIGNVELYINGSMVINNNGTIDFSKAKSSVIYNYAGTQSVYGTTYNNLTATTSGTKSLTGNVTVNTLLTTSGSAVLNASTFTLNGAANLTMTGTSNLTLSKTGVNLPELTGTSNSLAAGTTIAFNGSATQTAKGSSAANPSTTNTYPYQNIDLSGNSGSPLVNVGAISLISGNLTFTNLGKMAGMPVMTILGTFSFNPTITQNITNDMTVGSLFFSNGTLNYTGRTITVNGTNGAWTNNGGGTFINSGSFVIFTTGTGQRITGTASTSFANLTINNSGNVSLVGVDISVTSGLTLTTGKIITGANNVYVPTGGTVTRTSGYVDGNLQKDISAAFPSPTFEIGAGSVYAPLSLNFTGISSAGTITAFTTGTDHPGINASNIEPLKTANRYWSLKNSGAAFTTFDATFNFVAADLDPLANTANFTVKSTANGFTWSTTTVGTRTSTSTQFVNQPAATLPNTNAQIDFQCGELIVTSGIFNRITGANNWNNKATWIENRSGSVTFSSASNIVTGSSTDFINELVDGDIIMLQTSSGTIQGTVAAGGRTSATSLTLTSNAAANGSGGYGRERIPNAIGDVVTIGNPSIPVDATTTITYDMPTPTLVNTLNINTSSAPRAFAHTLTHTSTTLLTVQTNVTVNQPNANLTDAWNINAGQAAVLGSLTIGSTLPSNTSIGKVAITTGTLSVGSLVYNTGAGAGNEATAVLDINSSGTVNLSNTLNFVNGLGTLTPGTTSTFNFNGSAAQFLIFPTNGTATFKYNHLLFNNSSTSGVLISPSGTDISTANVTGNIRIQSGILITSDNTDIVGTVAKTFQIDPGATLRMTGNNSTFPATWTYNLGTTAPFGNVIYEQGTATNVTGVAYGNLKFIFSGVTYTLPGSGTSVAGSLTVGDGTSTPTLRGNSTLTFAVTGDVIINSGALINANTNNRIRNFTVGGNWTNNGTFTPSANTADVGVVFNGTGPSQPQIISGSAADAFFRLTLNTSSATNLVQMNKSMSVTNLLTLTQGGLNPNGNQLSITNASTAAIVRTGGYIKSEKTSFPYSEVKWSTNALTGSFVFPFGKSSTEYIPFTYNITAAGSSPSTMTVSTYATANDNTPYPSTVTNLNGTSGGSSVVDRFWILTPSSNTTKPTATLTFTAVGGSSPITTPPSERPGTISNLSGAGVSLTAQSWSAVNYWNAPSAGQTFTNNSPATDFFQVVVPAQLIQNNVSPWTVTDAAVPLPIKLVNFTANLENGVVALRWNTETELRNDFFTVQKSQDGETFLTVAKVKGAGTSTEAKAYTAFDNQPSAGRWYYRLQQTDFDGAFTYSKLVAVDIEQNIARSIYPNPSSGSEFNVNFGEDDLGKDASIQIMDIGGKEIARLQMISLDSQQVKVEMSQTLPAGMYIVTISVGQQVVRQKMVVR